MTELAIRATGLSKQYRLGSAQSYRTLRESVTSFATAPLRGARSAIRPGERPRPRSARETIWALDDVSFDIGRGETVAIVGRNGSGKSTLLKVLSRITDPTRGRAEIFGRISALLEVGTGFHPELTGRENVYLNGAILGMTRAEIQSRFDEIVGFSEIERFLDTPVKYYSSGMYVRLAFSVAAHLEPDILVVDEVLAVGDQSFQKKCLGKMEDVAHGGRTVLFVSHNMPAVLNLCRRAILLQAGQAVADGPCTEVIQHYMKGLEETTGVPLSERSDRRGTGDIRFTDFSLHNGNGEVLPRAVCGETFVLSLSYSHRRQVSVKNVQIAIGVHGRLDENLFLLSTDIQGVDLGTLPREGRLSCSIPRLPLLPGRYNFTVFATVGGEISDWIENAGSFDVEPGDFFESGKLPPIEQGPYAVEHFWTAADFTDCPTRA